MHAHVFKAVVPYVYPLYKIHKLTQQQILERTTPPIRLVHATKEGPLYRLEKWVSPYLTEVSRAYCQEEFLLDSPDLLNKIEDINTDRALQDLGTNVNLFTLDVVNLYPSIKPDTALLALDHALGNSSMDPHRNFVRQLCMASQTLFSRMLLFVSRVKCTRAKTGFQLATVYLVKLLMSHYIGCCSSWFSLTWRTIGDSSDSGSASSMTSLEFGQALEDSLMHLLLSLTASQDLTGYCLATVNLENQWTTLMLRFH